MTERNDQIRGGAPSNSNGTSMGPGREMPHNLEAEQGLLGAIMVNNRAYDPVSDFLRPEHFADPVNGRIFEMCAKAIERGQTANPVTLKRTFDQDEALKDTGGAAYLVRLAAAVVTLTNAADYGREIRDCYIRRQIILAGQSMAATASDTWWKARRGNDIEEMDADKLLAHATQYLDEIQAHGITKGEYVSAVSGVDVAMERAETIWREGAEAAGASTGITDLDRRIGGLMPGRFYILGGRPAMGKTALALRIARNLARQGKTVGIVSREMPADELGARLLAMESGITQERQEAGDLEQSDFDKLVAARMDIAGWPLHIDCRSTTVPEIRRRAVRLRRKHGLSLLVIDYLQLLRGVGASVENRVQEISQISMALKALATDLEIPVLALSQLSRAVEQRDDKRPRLADLRESGSLEQDADVVMFAYRAEYYLAKEEPMQRSNETSASFVTRQGAWSDQIEANRNLMDIIIDKHRSRGTSTVRLYSNLAVGVIDNGIRGFV
ncbi:replicative DNA helicase [Thalassobaculum sp.]